MRVGGWARAGRRARTASCLDNDVAGSFFAKLKVGVEPASVDRLA